MENRLYKDLAHLWPLLDPPEEYTEEASFWRQAIREKLGPGRHEVLELGVGGGHLLSHLTGDVQATAVDISPQMLAHSKALNPGVEHHLGDMRSVRLGRKFQAVLIHDAISYLLIGGRPGRHVRNGPRPSESRRHPCHGAGLVRGDLQRHHGGVSDPHEG